MVYHRPVVGEGEPFKLDSIRKEQPPAGVEGVGWHRYVITQANSTIVGHRQGSTSSVTRAVEEIVLHLNERRIGNFSWAMDVECRYATKKMKPVRSRPNMNR